MATILRVAVFAFACLVAASGLSSRALAGPEIFRCETEGVLRNRVSLDGLRVKIEAGLPVTILAVGSSSTEGAGASGPNAAYPPRLEERLGQLWPGAGITVINAGKGGEPAERTLQRLSAEIRARAYDLVIWQVGTNDAVRGGRPAAFADVVRRGVAVIRDGGATPLLVDQQFFPKIEGSTVYADYVATVETVSNDASVPLHSRHAMMKRWRERGEAELLRGLAADGFHMNDTGYACMAEGLARDIAKMTGTPSRIGVTSARAL